MGILGNTFHATGVFLYSLKKSAFTLLLLSWDIERDQCHGMD